VRIAGGARRVTVGRIRGRIPSILSRSDARRLLVLASPRRGSRSASFSLRSAVYVAASWASWGARFAGSHGRHVRAFRARAGGNPPSCTTRRRTRSWSGLSRARRRAFRARAGGARRVTVGRSAARVGRSYRDPSARENASASLSSWTRFRSTVAVRDARSDRGYMLAFRASWMRLSCAGDFEARPCQRSLASAPIRSHENRGVECEV